MKRLLLSFVILHSSFVIAQDSAALAKDLQAADAAHWPAINALLIAQRAELTAAHLAALKATQAEHAEALQAALDHTQIARTKQLAAETKLTAKEQRIKAVLETKLAAETQENAALKLAEGPRSKLLRELLTEAAKPELDLKREALQAEIAAKQKELEQLK